MALGVSIGRREPPTSMLRLPLDQIGGGRVVQPFTSNGRRIKAGENLTAAFICSLPANNRAVLFGKYIHVWPKSGDADPPPASTDSGQRPERHVVALGFGRFTVIEGVCLSDKPLTRKLAYELAGKTEPEMKVRKRA